MQSASPSKRGLTVVRVPSGSLNGPVLTQANLTSLLHHKHKNGTGSDVTSGRKERRSDFWMNSISHGQVGYARAEPTGLVSN